MNEENEDRERALNQLVESWKIAASRLGFRIDAPFELRAGDRRHQCVARVPDFGGPHGMVILVMFEPDFEIDLVAREDAVAAGYYWSCLNAESYVIFEESQYVDTLIDWGYFGPADLRPRWLEA